MPKNTGAGFVIAALCAAMGFALIWHMWVPAMVAFVGVLAAVIVHTFNYKRDFYIPANEVAAVENDRTRLMTARA
jgi:cytochrome o ubiquinol oxidase subunit 1